MIHTRSFCLLFTALLNSFWKEVCGDDGRMYDVIFVLDDSKDIGESEWSQQKTFVGHIIDTFNVGTDKTLMGALQVNENPQVITNLSDTKTADDAKQAISGATYRGHTTSKYESGALYAFYTMLANRRRHGSIGVIIGISQDDQVLGSEMKNYFVDAELNGVTFMMIGLEHDVSAAAQSKDYYWSVRESSHLNLSLAEAVAAKICPPCGDSGTMYDIVFLMDYLANTTSMSNQKNFIKSVIDQFVVGRKRTLSGLIMMSDNYRIAFNLGEQITTTDIKNAIDSLKQDSSVGSNYELGARIAYYTLLRGYRRIGSKGVVFGISGSAHGASKTMTKYVADASSFGDVFAMVSVGSNFTDASSIPSYYWYVPSWSGITTSLAKEAASRICSRGICRGNSEIIRMCQPTTLTSKLRYSVDFSTFETSPVDVCECTFRATTAGKFNMATVGFSEIDNCGSRLEVRINGQLSSGGSTECAKEPILTHTVRGGDNVTLGIFSTSRTVRRSSFCYTAEFSSNFTFHCIAGVITTGMPRPTTGITSNVTATAKPNNTFGQTKPITPPTTHPFNTTKSPTTPVLCTTTLTHASKVFNECKCSNDVFISVIVFQFIAMGVIAGVYIKYKWRQRRKRKPNTPQRKPSQKYEDIDHTQDMNIYATIPSDQPPHPYVEVIA